MITGRKISDPKFQVDALDGLRGLAVLIVFLGHTSYRGTFLFPFADFTGFGKSGVYLFFVLSSFLLTYAFITNGKSALDRYFMFNYLVRRFFRIFPLYFLYLLAGLLVSSILLKVIGANQPVRFPYDLSVKVLIDHLLLQQGQGITWSIPVEFRYYFILPFLAMTYLAVLKNRLVPSIVLSVVLIAACEFFWPQQETLPNDTRLGQYLPVFFMGSLLAVVQVHWQRLGLSENKKSKLTLEALGISAATSVILLIPSVSSYLSGEKIPFDHYHKQIILFGALWCLVLFASVNGYGWMRKMFETRFLRYCGFISYSMYLWHLIVVDAVRNLAPRLPFQGWVMFFASIAVSHLTWFAVERPTSRIRISNRKQ